MGIKDKIKKIIKLTNEKNVVSIQMISDEGNILEGKVAVVLGATGGMGGAIARSVYESGASVILCGTNENKLKYLKDTFDDNERIRTHIFNIDDFDNIQKKVDEINLYFNGVDIVINSVGVHTENVDFITMTPDEYDRVMRINLKSPYFVFQEFAKHMIQNKQPGHFLLVSSSRGSEPAWSPYGISKWGVNGMVQGLGKILLPYGIIVNGIAPGNTATELIGFKDGDNLFSDENGLKRLVTPEEVGNIARLLVSPAGDMVVGEVIHLSGGRGVWDIR